MYVTDFNLAQVVDKFGRQLGAQFYNLQDANGNFYTGSQKNNNIVDTLGRTPISSSTNGSVTTYTLQTSQGPESYTVTTATIRATTSLGQSGVSECVNCSITVIQSIGLPNGTSYTFGYNGQGELSSVTLPTGGQITLGYTNYLDSYNNHNYWISSREENGATWSYTPTRISTCGVGQTGCMQKVTVVKPSGDNIVYTFTMNNGGWNS